MLRTSLALATAALTLAAAPAVASAQDDLRVFFPGNCERNAYKPSKIVVACADAGFVVKKIRWGAYGDTRAVGAGTARVNDCDPDCAGGTFHSYDAKVTLSRVRQCGDVPQFTRLKVTFTGDRPKGMDRSETQRRPCAEAPKR
ncbi:MAG TPA: hypothetical protein VFR97_05940 [Capillimicrobium sp.]|nr:hypothetical protein [Capillimicrobium sp.]